MCILLVSHSFHQIFRDRCIGCVAALVVHCVALIQAACSDTTAMEEIINGNFVFERLVSFANPIFFAYMQIKTYCACLFHSSMHFDQKYILRNSFLELGTRGILIPSQNIRS